MRNYLDDPDRPPKPLPVFAPDNRGGSKPQGFGNGHMFDPRAPPPFRPPFFDNYGPPPPMFGSHMFNGPPMRRPPPDWGPRGGRGGGKGDWGDRGGRDRRDERDRSPPRRSPPPDGRRYKDTRELLDFDAPAPEVKDLGTKDFRSFRYSDDEDSSSDA